MCKKNNECKCLYFYLHGKFLCMYLIFKISTKYIVGLGTYEYIPNILLGNMFLNKNDQIAKKPLTKNYFVFK